MTPLPLSRRIVASDGVSLAVTDVGEGPGEAIVFVHEFSGDRRSWAGQIAAMRARRRCVAYDARGYPASDVPPDGAAYSQARAADDLADVIRGLGLGRAHVVGLSMGGFAALHAAIRHPDLVRSLVVAGCGYGARPDEQDRYRAAMRTEAAHAASIGMAAYADEMGASRYAQLLRAKDETAWRRFVDELAEHSVDGMAATLRAVLGARPSLWHIEAELKAIACPVMLMIGDEDTPCLEPNLHLARTLPDAALCVLPRTGHLPNLEEPALFDMLVDRFVAAVESGGWSRLRNSLASRKD